MLNRFLLAVTVLTISFAAMADNEIALGRSRVSIPTGWSEVTNKTDVRVFRSPSTNQQVTATLVRVVPNTSFDDFRKLCEKRVELEKRELKQGFVDPAKPFRAEGTFGMFFSGGDKQSGRLFSGYLSLANGELITVYLESFGLPPKEHLETYQSFVKIVKRK